MTVFLLVPLKSRYWWYRDFAYVQRFAAITGTNPLIQLAAWKFSSAALGLLLLDCLRIESQAQPLFDKLH